MGAQGSLSVGQLDNVASEFAKWHASNIAQVFAPVNSRP
jgi:hypothetical protein